MHSNLQEVVRSTCKEQFNSRPLMKATANLFVFQSVSQIMIFFIHLEGTVSFVRGDISKAFSKQVNNKNLHNLYGYCWTNKLMILGSFLIHTKYYCLFGNIRYI